MNPDAKLQQFQIRLDFIRRHPRSRDVERLCDEIEKLAISATREFARERWVSEAKSVAALLLWYGLGLCLGSLFLH
jgi:hypothetical protein